MVRNLPRHTAIAVVLFTLTSCGPQHGSILPNLRQELDRHPDMAVEDVYKFVHQAAFGNRHLLEHGDAKLMLLQEWDEISADSTQPLVEDLSPDGQMVRLNLRPFKARGGNPDSLWTAIQRTADVEVPGEDAFQEWWQEIDEESQIGTIPVSVGDVREFYDARWKEGLPVVHHSPGYEKAYAPSYRVLVRSELTKLGL